MAKDETRRLSPATLVEDETNFAALLAVNNYQPINATNTVTKAQNLKQQQKHVQDAEAQVEAAYKAARDNANAMEWQFHNYMLGVKDQVRAQFGADSNELQSIGLKKKTERKAPARAKKS